MRKFTVLRSLTYSLMALGLLGAIGLAFAYSDHFHVFLWTACVLGLLCIGIGWQIIRLWRERRGSRFRLKVVTVFSFSVIGPCIVMAVFAILFLKVGLQAWFHQRVQTAVQESQTVAYAYLHEHQKVIEHTIRTMAKGLNNFFDMLASGRQLAESNPEAFFQHHQRELEEYLTVHEAFRSVKEAIIFRIPPEKRELMAIANRVPLTVVAHSRLSFSLGLKFLSSQDIQKADAEGIFMALNDTGDQVFAVVPVFEPLHAYLLVSRDVDKKVLQKIKRATEASDAYTYLLKKQEELSLQFVIIFCLFTLLLLLVAILGGLTFSRQLMNPIEQLINAAQNVRMGNFVPIPYSAVPLMEELGALIQTFNSMVADISRQKQNLLQVNQRLQERTYFIESVLSGVSSGVLSVTSQGMITLANQRAAELLNQTKCLENRLLEDVVPVFYQRVHQAMGNPRTFQDEQVTINCMGRTKVFHLHILTGDGESVLTFDDVTELLIAQKKAAWADVARRIAHEVKNPLTPILLSAERLKRKYALHIDQSPEVFHSCIETIIRQVGYIGKLISEFSAFARMPAPSFKRVDLDELIRQEIMLQQQAYPHLCFQYSSQAAQVWADPQQLSQVLTNLIKNAIEAVGEIQPGQITIQLQDADPKIILQICDNGPGWSASILTSLGEPYVTTKPGGTGLGLAIVKKIVEDHSGTISFFNLIGSSGACVKIELMKYPPA